MIIFTFASYYKKVPIVLRRAKTRIHCLIHFMIELRLAMISIGSSFTNQTKSNISLPITEQFFSNTLRTNDAVQDLYGNETRFC